MAWALSGRMSRRFAELATPCWMLRLSASLSPGATRSAVGVLLESSHSCLLLASADWTGALLSSHFCLVPLSCTLVLCRLLVSGPDSSVSLLGALQTTSVVISLIPALDVVALP